MAISEMKKLTLLGLNGDRARLLKQMQRMGCVEIVRPAEEAERPGDLRLEEQNQLVDRLDWAISRLAKHDPIKAGLFALKPTADDETLSAAQAGKSALLETVSRLEEIERTRGDLKTREARERAQIEQLRPWAALPMTLDRLAGTKNVAYQLVSVPESRIDAFTRSAGELPVPPAFEEISRLGGKAYLLAATHRREQGELDKLIGAHDAERVSLESSPYTAAMLIDQSEDKLRRYAEVRTQLDVEEVSLARDIQTLRLLRDAEAAARDRSEAASRLITTKSAFLLEGWVPGSKAEALEAALKRVSSCVEIELRDPLPEEQPPTLLKNGPVITPFESIVRMFSMPDPRGIDPTFIMMPYFVCFFGMMVSDAGYGVILALAAAFISRKLRGKGGIGQIASILAIGGVATLFWGALFGGWFGVEWKPLLFVPMNEPLKMMILCIALGAVHLFTGLGVAAYMNVKRGKPLAAVFDQGFWFLFLIGLGLLLFFPTVGAVLAIAGAGGIVLTAGRDKPKLLSKLLGGFGALYGVTGYMSDLLSYARLFGMGLATGVIGMVINTVATMLMGNAIGMVFAIVILVGGHLFNLGINTLGAYVHACRLQYIEFFGKFYESGGVEFKPLKSRAKYVEIVEGDAIHNNN